VKPTANQELGEVWNKENGGRISLFKRKYLTIVYFYVFKITEAKGQRQPEYYGGILHAAVYLWRLIR
jgi:hypothetical protein